MAGHWYEKRQVVRWKKNREPGEDPQKDGQLVLEKRVKAISCGEDGLFQKARWRKCRAAHNETHA